MCFHFKICKSSCLSHPECLSVYNDINHSFFILTKMFDAIFTIIAVLEASSRDETYVNQYTVCTVINDQEWLSSYQMVVLKSYERN